METHQLRAVNDAAAAMFGIAAESLSAARSTELLPGYVPGEDPARAVDVAFARARRHAGRARTAPRIGLVRGARLLAFDRARRDARTCRARGAARHRRPRRHARGGADRHLPRRRRPATSSTRTAAFHALLGLDAGTADGLSLQQFEHGAGGESTIRSVAIGSSGQLTQETRWRRPDGTIFDVEVAATVVDGVDGNRVLTVRDVSARRRAQERADRESRRSVGAAGARAARASYTESETLSHALELVQKLTGSEAGYVFLATADAGQFELAARRDGSAATHDLSVLTRWRGLPPADTALYDCLSSQRAVPFETESRARVACGRPDCPARCNRQLATPMLDGGRLAGVLLLADKKEPFDEEDRAARGAGRRCAEPGAAATSLGRRGRERHGSHGAGDAGRGRGDGRAVGDAGRLQDRSREARRRTGRRHRHGARPARAHRCAGCASWAS